MYIAFSLLTCNTSSKRFNPFLEKCPLFSYHVNPRLEKVRTAEKEAAERKERNRQDITLGEAWPIYLEERKASWSDSYYNLHIRLIQAGGEQRKRFKGKTVPGPLAPLAKLPISSICPSTVKKWLNKEKQNRHTQTRIAFETLGTFLNWCQDDERYIGLASPDACSSKIKRENLGRKNARNDCLEKSQLAAWFKAVKSYEHKGLVMATYVQSLLLTGARREELLTLKWSDLDFHWGRMKITGKGNIERVIPMPPYLAHILNALPRKNEWVFSSRTGKLKRLQSPTKAHQLMCIEAGLEGLSLHGLRRSFSTLAEWTECSAGIIAQIQGHSPSAIAEKHYKKRPLDLLRTWHEKIEKFILCEAGIEQPQTASVKPLSLVEVKHEKKNPA